MSARTKLATIPTSMAHREPGIAHRVCDMYRTKINAQAVEHGFRTAHHDGCCHAGKGIRSVFFENIEEQTI